MYYCENCYLLNEDDVCAFCGSRLTRGPKADDYCFIGNKCSPWAEMLHGILEDDHIPVIVRQWSELMILGAIIVLRGALTFLIHWEITREESKL